MIDADVRAAVDAKAGIWIIANVLILFCAPILHYIYLDRLLDYEYASGIRTSTDGDIILIPVIGGFIFLVIVLFIVNAVAMTYLQLRYYRKGVRKLPASHSESHLKHFKQ